MAAAGSPWSARRVGDTTLQEAVRKVMLTYWNTVAFHSLYARANNWHPPASPPRWRTARCSTATSSATQQLVRDVTAALEAFDTQRYGALISAFVDELSNFTSAARVGVLGRRRRRAVDPP